MNIIQQIVILAPPLLFALTIHEYAHGYVAWRLGDSTAKSMGRLTMNPLAHIDPLGVLAFIIMKIGWAKPVPVDPRNFRTPLKDMVWVALAGPFANLATAVASSLLLKLVIPLASVLPPGIAFPLFQMLIASVWINIMLAVFNLLPIPPLDGSRVLMGLVNHRQAAVIARLEPFGFIILLALFYTGIIPKIIRPIVSFAERLIIG